MKNKDIIIVASLTLVTVFFWMISEVLHTSQKNTLTPTLQTQIKPIVPKFDTEVIQLLKERQANK